MLVRVSSDLILQTEDIQEVTTYAEGSITRTRIRLKDGSMRKSDWLVERINEAIEATHRAEVIYGTKK